MAVALAIASCPLPATWAQDRPAASPEAPRKPVQRRQPADDAQREAALRKDLGLLAVEREQLNIQLMETASLIQKAEAQMTAIEARLGDLEAQEKLVRGSLDRRHDSIAKLLSALQRMGRNPPPVVVTRREDALQMVRSAMLLASAFPELRTQALELAGRLNELARIMDDIRGEGDKLKAETARLSETQIRLAGLMEVKRQSQASHQAELDEVRKAAGDIARNVTDLSDLIARLDKVVSAQTNLGDYDKEVDLAQSQAQVSTRSASPETVLPRGIVAPVPEPATRRADAGTAGAKDGETKLASLVPPRLSPPAIELAPGSGGVTGHPGRLKPALPFHLAKAKLPLPAQGRRVQAFGDRTQFGGQSKGIILETRHTAQITAPCDGWVVYSGPFRTYGQLLIINAGGGYHVLLAGLSQVHVQLGQFVLAAEPIGTMSAAPKPTTGNAASNSPVLYIEFRKDGRPIDPDPWWVEGHQKVQG